MKMQVVKIVNTRWVESLLLLTATWEQLLTKKKELLSLSQAMKEDLPKQGCMCEEVGGFFFRVFLALRRLDPKE